MIHTAPPVSATYQQLVTSGSNNVVLAPLRVEAPVEVRRLSASVMRVVSGTSYVALTLYRLAPYGATTHDISDLSFTDRRWLRVDGIGTANIVAVAAGNPVHVDRDFPKAMRLTDDVYYAAIQVSDSDAWALTSPAETASSSSRNLSAGFQTLPAGASMGDFPAELRFAGSYAPLPIIVGFSTLEAYKRYVHSI